LKPADVRARLKRLKALSDGFKAELVGIAIDPWPLYPAESPLYLKAIGDAQDAVERALGVLRHAADRLR
jgi:hypothetical protein